MWNKVGGTTSCEFHEMYEAILDYMTIISNN